MATTDALTIESTVGALYESISGGAGEARDWARLRYLFRPEARLVRTRLGPDGRPQIQFYTLDEFIAEAEPYFRQNGFYEVEIARTAESFGNISHLFSTYEARAERASDSSLGRGINSIQLYHDGSRWWIVNMIWDDEREGDPIPPRYLA